MLDYRKLEICLILSPLTSDTLGLSEVRGCKTNRISQDPLIANSGPRLNYLNGASPRYSYIDLILVPHCSFKNVPKARFHSCMIHPESRACKVYLSRCGD